jgi:hypothetical protein
VWCLNAFVSLVGPAGFVSHYFSLVLTTLVVDQELTISLVFAICQSLHLDSQSSQNARGCESERLQL